MRKYSSFFSSSCGVFHLLHLCCFMTISLKHQVPVNKGLSMNNSLQCTHFGHRKQAGTSENKHFVSSIRCVRGLNKIFLYNFQHFNFNQAFQFIITYPSNLKGLCEFLTELEVVQYNKRCS